METDSGTPVRKQADSKDFPEHLRTIHFTLVLTCLALTIIVSAPPSFMAEKAAEQLVQVKEVVAGWETDWLQQYAQQLSNGPKCPQDFSDSISIEIEKHPIALKFDKWTLIPGDTSGPNSRPAAPKMEGTAVYLPQPGTLSEFRTAWDSSLRLVCSPTRSPEVWLLKDRDYGDDNSAITILKKLHLQPTKTGPEPFTPAQIVETKPFFSPSEPPEASNFPYIFVFSTDYGRSAAIPITKAGRVVFNLRDAIATAWPRYTWPTRPFKEGFYELDQVTDGFQDLPFEDLSRIIRWQLANAKETFEAFGVKFPIGTTARSGTLILLAIQLYLWLHLAEYRKRKFANSEIAWIGLYPSRIANGVFVLTIVVAPTALIIYLLLFQRDQGFSPPGLNIIFCVLAATLGGLCWYEHWKTKRNDGTES